jgi:hypothetical protein
VAITCQFVDSIAASPTVRLELNSYAGGLMVAGEPALSPPPIRRVSTTSMLADGESIPAWAFGNRTIRVGLQPTVGTGSAAADALQALARELCRDSNILRVNLGTADVFFRTFAAPDAAYNLLWKSPKDSLVTVEIPCEPFGYGVETTLSPVTVNNNPAAGSNGMFLDVTGVKGDVETPLHLTLGSTVVATGQRRSGWAVRRRGTPSATPFFLQAEAMTMGTDTTVQANVATMSGAGSNFVRTTFATAAMTQRLSIATYPSSASVDARGVYRVFVRVRQNTAGDVIASRLRWGSADNTITNATVTWPTGDTGIKYLDHGLVQIPVGYDPVTRGIAGLEVAAEGIFLALDLQRVSGSGTADVDVLLFLPADDRHGYAKWPATASVTDFILEGGRRPAAYARNASAQVRSTKPVELSGGGLMVSPGVTNRVFFCLDLGTGTAAAGGGDAIANTVSVTGFYYPRYLFPLRPVST